MTNPAQQPTMRLPTGDIDMGGLMQYLQARYPGFSQGELSPLADEQAQRSQSAFAMNSQPKQQQPSGPPGLLGNEPQQTRGLFDLKPAAPRRQPQRSIF